MTPISTTPIDMALFKGQAVSDALSDNSLLLESGDFLLLEDGVSTLLLES